jgi:YD repeat-containing protein
VSLTTDEYIEGRSAPMYGTLTQYDTLGRMLTNSGTQLWNTQTAYDSEGRVSESIAADGQVTDYEYDSLGRKTAVVGTSVSLADAGLTPQDVGLTSSTGVTLRLRNETVYDSLGRVQVEKTNIREVVLPDGTIQIDRSAEQDTSYEYDEFGNLLQTTYADGTTTSSTYDIFGRKTSDTNQLGQTRTYQYDADGRLISVTLPAVANPATGQAQQPVYVYGYDALGNQTLIQDPLGRQTLFSYDDQGHQLTRTLPLGATDTGNWTETFQYDARGRQVLHVSFEGVVTQYVYDSHTGLLVQENFFDSVADYNNGQGTPNEIWTFVYDAFVDRGLKEGQFRGLGAGRRELPDEASGA